MEEPDFQKRTGGTMIILSWIVALGLLSWFFADYLSKQANPNQNLSMQLNQGVKEVILKRNRAGHYVASGMINQQPVTFILDTGATHISIPAHIARRIDLNQGIAMPVQTANGIAHVYATDLDSVDLGGIELKNIRANINPFMQTDEVLLGMSFLKYLDFSQQGDQLVIRQN